MNLKITRIPPSPVAIESIHATTIDIGKLTLTGTGTWLIDTGTGIALAVGVTETCARSITADSNISTEQERIVP